MLSDNGRVPVECEIMLIDEEYRERGSQNFLVQHRHVMKPGGQSEPKGKRKLMNAESLAGGATFKSKWVVLYRGVGDMEDDLALYLLDKEFGRKGEKYVLLTYSNLLSAVHGDVKGTQASYMNAGAVVEIDAGHVHLNRGLTVDPHLKRLAADLGKACVSGNLGLDFISKESARKWSADPSILDEGDLKFLTYQSSKLAGDVLRKGKESGRQTFGKWVEAHELKKPLIVVADEVNLSGGIWI